MRISRSTILLIGAGLLIGLGAGFVILAVLGVGGPLFSSFWNSRMGDSTVLFPEVDSPAPDFELQTLSGETYNLEALRGRPVLLNFWATWCGPCRLEMPLLEEYQARYGDDFTILAVNYDESPQQVQAFVDELGLTLPVLLDPGAQVVSLYRVRAYPTTIFIDNEGTIRYQHIGLLEERHLSRYLEELGVSLE